MNQLHHYWRFCKDGLVQAGISLQDNRLRSVLSILGVAVGVAAVMAVGTISEGGRRLIFDELETFGLRSVWVFRLNQEKKPDTTQRQGTGFDNSDLDLMEKHCCNDVRRLSPVIQVRERQWLVRAASAYSNAQVIGVNSHYLAINNDRLSSGRFFLPDDIVKRHGVAVIGPTVAADLFGSSSNPVGKALRIGERRYTVIGLTERKSRDFLASIGSAGGQDSNNQILLPYTTLQQQLGSKIIHFVQAEAIALERADAAAAELVSFFERAHQHRYAYQSDTMAKYIGTAERILRGVSLIGVVAASISLLVGGMGIMNVISTSVMERTREIGLRKAVGATGQHILFQFLMESVLISTLGGLLGLLAGVLIGIALAWLTGFPLIPSWSMALLGLLVSIVVGLLSGLIPAQRAARLRPVTALRYE
ncbi:ABC transporter permease [Herbaspirillum sp. AP02]|uniref:ABC transporter permease n=1 Tax=unclassified Herbaspirillum TaxID=2624150 RepID=UPI0015D9C288|nr:MULTISPECIES: ABC transporter permease [unclassified Herbaspirillum]MBG7620564.1 ABC transporter permease [Herbaspirillum sp. AP02]NZD68028.1 ABC transporter permease [Herbaspirillum sp. AP21]